jgi:hypothetical protein
VGAPTAILRGHFDIGYGPEEAGMAGAAKLAPELITGRVLLNLDSQTDATFTVGVDSIVRLDAPLEPVPEPHTTLRVTVGGARRALGRRHRGRSNGIKLLARALSTTPGLRLASPADDERERRSRPLLRDEWSSPRRPRGRPPRCRVGRTGAVRTPAAQMHGTR